VLDVMQLIVKGKGIFCTPAPPGGPGPVRLLHEAVPLAFLIEKCGGASSDGSVGSLLDVPVTNLGQRTQMAVGSVAEVERFNTMVGPLGAAPAGTGRE
jgi:sedoheptulose-bisphosphatase